MSTPAATERKSVCLFETYSTQLKREGGGRPLKIRLRSLPFQKLNIRRFERRQTSQVKLMVTLEEWLLSALMPRQAPAEAKHGLATGNGSNEAIL